jgi:hypothetical protein
MANNVSTTSRQLLFIVILFLLEPGVHHAQTHIMTLGVFHFEYPNLDVVKTAKEDQISVLDETYQSEIMAINSVLASWNPDYIAVEFRSDYQPVIDSLYASYLAGKYEPGINEVYQLGFRIGKMCGLDKIYCVDNPGRHYDSMLDLFSDSARLAAFEHYYLTYKRAGTLEEDYKVNSITEALIRMNRPEFIQKRLSPYLTHPFGYEELEGDFTGVDFESGRWFNRNQHLP